MFNKIVNNSHLKFFLCMSFPCMGYAIMTSFKTDNRRTNRLELSFRRSTAASIVSTVVLLCWYPTLKEPMIDLVSYLILLYTLIRVGTGISDVIVEPTPRAPSRSSVLKLVGGHLIVLSVLALLFVYERFHPKILTTPVIGYLLRFLRAKYEAVSLMGFVYLLVCAAISGSAGALVHSKTLPVEGVSDWITNITVLEMVAMVGMQIALASNVYSPGTFTSIE